MPSETIDLMVDAGHAKPNPSIAQKLGPMGINIGEVMNKINNRTTDFKGMQVPIKLTIDSKTKDIKIEVGTPPTTQLIKKELSIEKGSSKPDKEKVANISIEQCIKIAKMKKEAMFTNDLKSAVKTVAGSCNSLGVLIEGKFSNGIIKDIDAGKYDTEIKQEKTETPEEKKKLLKEQLTLVNQELSAKFAKLEVIPEQTTPEAKKEEIKEAKKEEIKKEPEKKKEFKEEKKK